MSIRLAIWPLSLRPFQPSNNVQQNGFLWWPRPGAEFQTTNIYPLGNDNINIHKITVYINGNSGEGVLALKSFSFNYLPLNYEFLGRSVATQEYLWQRGSRRWWLILPLSLRKEQIPSLEEAGKCAMTTEGHFKVEDGGTGLYFTTSLLTER